MFGKIILQYRKIVLKVWPVVLFKSELNLVLFIICDSYQESTLHRHVIVFGAIILHVTEEKEKKEEEKIQYECSRCVFVYKKRQNKHRFGEDALIIHSIHMICMPSVWLTCQSLSGLSNRSSPRLQPSFFFDLFYPMYFFIRIYTYFSSSFYNFSILEPQKSLWHWFLSFYSNKYIL